MIRGCGARRDPNTIYSTWGSRLRKEKKFRSGLLKHFSFCPPWWVDIKALGLSDSGIKIIERNDGSGIYDIYDIIGRSGYPWWPDYFEEADNYGTSRKIAKTSQFHLLSPESQHIYIYALANMQDPEPFYLDRQDVVTCPLGHEHHDNPQNGYYEMCTGLLWEAVGLGSEEPNRRYRRDIPVKRSNGEAPIAAYNCARQPQGIDVTWEYAGLLHTPIDAFEVIADEFADPKDFVANVLEDANNGIYYHVVEG